uniref:Uncharacterized protein n=1 Tax=Solanum lycopersicum TaxID=4081 RepID=A0A3Q7F526_SOLLC
MKITDGFASSIDCQLTTDHQLHHRRKKTRTPVKGGSGSASANQFLVSKFNSPSMEMECRGFEFFNGGAKMGVSARKLAAGLWHLAAEFDSAGGGSGGMKRQCGSIHPLPCWIPIPKSVMEGATKWDPGHFKTSREVNHSNNLVKLYERQRTATTSLAPALQLVELIRARIHIQELEADRRRLRKKFKHFARKLNEERSSWMRKECQKMHAIVDHLKDDLRRERRNSKQLDIVNSKLLVDLADSKLSSRQYMHDYENERKSRQLLEDSFLRANNVTVGMTDLIEVQVVKQVVDSLNIQETKEFCSSSPILNDIYTLNEGSIICEASKLGTNTFADYSTPCRSSAIQIVGTEVSKTCAMTTSSECLNSVIDHDQSCKDESGRETVTQVEGQFSNYTVGETEHSVNCTDRGRYLLCGKVNHEQNTGQSGSLDFETSDISLVLPKKPKKKGSSFRKLWRSSLSTEDFCKTISVDDSGRFSNGSTSNVDVVFSENVPAERALAYQDFVNHCCSGGPRNPHTARAMKGCIEWPRGIPKHGLKSKLLEARIQSQKSQLRSVLKHLN